jgi:hypothetical protein
MQYFFTTNLALASALSALGAKDRQPDPVTVEIDGAGKAKPEGKFWFEAKLPDGTQIAEIVKAWADKEWLLKNSNHPLAYMKAYAANRLTWLKWMDEANPLVRHTRGNKVMLLALDMCQDDVAAFTKQFNELSDE